MVQQTKDSTFTKYKSDHAESGLSNSDKQLSVEVTANKTSSNESYKENLTAVSESIGENVEITGSERPIPPKRNAGSGHIVYVRRKTETEVAKAKLSDTKTDVNCLHLRKPTDQGRSITPSLGTVTHGRADSANPSSVDPVTLKVKGRDSSSLLKKLDQCDRNDYAQELRSLSSIELSMRAVELEKRSIRLSLEEARELERVRFLDVLGKRAHSTHSSQQGQ